MDPTRQLPPADRSRSRVIRAAGRAAGLALLVLLPAALGAAAGGGCAAVGAIAYATSPPPTVKAKYVPAKVPTVVLVQRSHNPADAAQDAERISRYVTADLKEHGIGPLIDPSALLGVQAPVGGSSVWRARLDPATRPTTAAAPVPRTASELGRAVGAKQVLFVDLVGFKIEPAIATEMVKGEIDARVRIVDADTGQTLWPEDTTQGYAVTVGVPYSDAGMKLDEAGVRDVMCHNLAEHVARLFYTWQANAVDSGSPTD